MDIFERSCPGLAIRAAIVFFNRIQIVDRKNMQVDIGEISCSSSDVRNNDCLPSICVAHAAF